MKRRMPIILLSIPTVAVVGIFLMRDAIQSNFFKPTGSTIEQGISGYSSPDIETVAQDLTVPWGMVFLPNGDLLVTQRSGILDRIGQNKQSHEIEGVEHVGEGGLLGLALDPKFEDNHRIYLYMTMRIDGALSNRIERYTYKDDKLFDRKVILQNIPGEINHDGGRLAFGPDGFLYVTTGDAGHPPNSQNKNSLAGKILRITTDGQQAPGNPFDNEVYSYGHRNPQGLAWDGKGQLWETEHGLSSSESGYDELNLIKPGGNYGWPDIRGDESKIGMEKPIVHSGPNETWAPGGLAYSNGSLFFAGLRGQSLYEAKIGDSNSVTLKAHFKGEYGRMRTTAINGNYLYVTTSNTDGRGSTQPDDDKIIKIKLSLFN